jgi:hypothetical protein
MAGMAGCGMDTGEGTGAQPSPRTYVMGFSPIPPRPDTALAIRTIDTWATHADAGLMLYEPPWERLLAGDDPDALVRANELGLADDYRRKSAWFQITFMDIDLAAAPPPPGSILPLFAALGLVDASLAPKLALSAWDEVFRRPYRP